MVTGTGGRNADDARPRKANGAERKERAVAPLGDGEPKAEPCGGRKGTPVGPNKTARRIARLCALVEQADLGRAERNRLLALANAADLVNEGEQEGFDKGFAQLVALREALFRATKPVRRESLRSDNVFRLDRDADEGGAPDLNRR